MSKRLIIGGAALLACLGGYLAYPVVDADHGVATAAKKTYSGTLYVAGHGGHFAKAEVVVDPNAPAEPIKMVELDRIEIGDSKTHAFHDSRIDAADRNTIFWSTYIPDPNGKMHVGKSDLKTGKVIKDVTLTPDPRSPATKPPMYCASGQSKGYYMPIFMGTEGYVDVFDKKTLEQKHRVFVSELGYKPGTYKFTHGINTPDMKKFVLVMNQAEAGKGNGKVDVIFVDMAALEQGKLKQVAKATFTGEPDKTLTFRQYFSSDGKLLYQSAGDRLWVIDTASLKLVDEKMIPEGGQVHDAFPTPDNKYAVMTVRMLAAAPGTEGKEVTDGLFLLYSADEKKIVGKATSTCIACHKNFELGKSAVLCGVDGNWKR